MTTRTITIVVNEHGFHVHEGERFCNWLTWDEMLGQIAILTMPRGLKDPDRTALFRMQTPEQMLEEKERRAARQRAAEEEHATTIEGETAP